MGLQSALAAMSMLALPPSLLALLPASKGSYTDTWVRSAPAKA